MRCAVIRSMVWRKWWAESARTSSRRVVSDARCTAGTRGDRPGFWSTYQAPRRLNAS